MKKILSLVFTFVFLINTSFAFAKVNITEQEKVDAFNFLLNNGIIEVSEKNNLEEHISKAEFWRVSLLLAGYLPSTEDKLFFTPIKGVSSDKWYSQYANTAYKNGLLDKYKGKSLDPDSQMRKLESLEFTFKLFGISTPMFNDMIMDFKDVKNDHPVVSKCLQLGLCTGETSYIFGANKPIKKIEAYDLLVKSYSFVYEHIGGDQVGSLPIITEVYSTILNEYYKVGDLSSKDLIYGAAEGMADAVGDKYTTFMRPVSSKDFNESLNGSFEGIGAYVEKDKDGVRIVTPINGSPAKKAGLKANDLIIEVEGESVVDLTLKEVISLIKGPDGTFVNIKIKRGNEYINFRIKRAKVEVPSAESRIEDGILILMVNQFGRNTQEEIENAIEENDEINSIIFDLRHNPGGYLSVAEDALSMFVDYGELIVSVKYPKYELKVKSKNSKKIEGKNIVILIDEASASASEIFAGTMQDYNLAKIVGKTSYGKGTVQTIMEFTDGSQFKYTIANWLTGKGNAVEGVGIKPDFEVEDDPERFGDEMLERAKELVY